MKPLYGWGMLRSMAIAYKNLFRPKITVQYPHERIELPERARWAVEPCFGENGESLCTACRLCERACPNHTISIEVETGEDKSKRIARWRYQLGSCMMCGLCVEACPFGAIHMSHTYELARIDPATLEINLLVDVPVAMPKRSVAASKTKAAPEPPREGEAKGVGGNG